MPFRPVNDKPTATPEMVKSTSRTALGGTFGHPSAVALDMHAYHGTGRCLSSQFRQGGLSTYERNRQRTACIAARAFVKPSGQLSECITNAKGDWRVACRRKAALFAFLARP